MGIEQAYNFRRVDEQVSTAGIPTREQLGELEAAGVDLVINLLPDSSEYAIDGERAIVEGQGVTYRHIPVDFSAPTQGDFDAFSEVMEQAQGKSLFVHCAANYRVSAFYARYAVETGRWTREEASRFIASVWDPSGHPPWPAFLRGSGIGGGVG